MTIYRATFDDGSFRDYSADEFSVLPVGDSPCDAYFWEYKVDLEIPHVTSRVLVGYARNPKTVDVVPEGLDKPGLNG